MRLLSYNIQGGIASHRYHDYILQGWKHLLPHARRRENLDGIAHHLSAFDVVGLQEVDSGSVRTSFVNQTQYLAEHADFPFWHDQTTRNFGRFAQHSNGLLSRLMPRELVEHRLPGLPGRGALMVRFGASDTPLVLFVIHLALGKMGRLRQVAYLTDLVNQHPHVVLMGDLNCDEPSLEMNYLLRHTKLRRPSRNSKTFPSWHPRRSIDHILATPAIRVERSYVPEWSFSDHRPIAVDAVVPSSVGL